MKRILKIVGTFVGVLLVVVVLLVGVLFIRSNQILNTTYDAPEISIVIPTDAATLERGRYLAEYVSVCVDCHGENFAGGVVVDDPALGRIVAPNLTSGQNGVGTELTDMDFAQIVRYGVLPGGKSVRVMPSDDYSHLSEADLAAIVAYVRSLPPVDSHLPPTELKPFGRILLGAGQLDVMIAKRIDFSAEHSYPPAAVTVEYGHYLADIAGCTSCHHPDLAGGAIPGAPPDWPMSANITTGGVVAGWSEADFIQTIRTGVDPSGHILIDEMPWKRYAGMTDGDLQAIWMFLQSVPPMEVSSNQ